jgi:hypothetical protein
MLRQLDQRQADGLTITLEWDSDTGDVLVRCEDRLGGDRRSRCSRVEPQHAGFAFLYPAALQTWEPQDPEAQDRRWHVSCRWHLARRALSFRVAGVATGVIYVLLVVVALLLVSPRRCTTPAGRHDCVVAARIDGTDRTVANTGSFAARPGTNSQAMTRSAMRAPLFTPLTLR